MMSETVMTAIGYTMIALFVFSVVAVEIWRRRR